MAAHNGLCSAHIWLFGTEAPLDAAGTRAAVGLASADLDTQLAAIAAGAIDSDLFSHDSAEQFANGLVRNLAE